MVFGRSGGGWVSRIGGLVELIFLGVGDSCVLGFVVVLSVCDYYKIRRGIVLGVEYMAVGLVSPLVRLRSI